MNAQAALKIEEQPVEDIQTVARRFLSEHDSNVDAALPLFMDWVRENIPSRPEEIFQKYCHSVLATGRRQERRVSWTGRRRASASFDSTGERLLTLARSNAEHLLDFPLPTGKTLQYATRADIQTTYHMYMKGAIDMTHKALFFKLILESSNAEKPASELGEERLLELQEQARPKND